jgi:hypothetical protein
MHPSPSILSTQALLLCSLRHLPGLVVGRAMNNPVDVTHRAYGDQPQPKCEEQPRQPPFFYSFPVQIVDNSLCSPPLLKGCDQILAGTDLYMGLAMYRSTITT